MYLDRYFLPDVESELLNLVDLVLVGTASDDRSGELPKRWANLFKKESRCIPYDTKLERCGYHNFNLGDEATRTNVQATNDITILYGLLDSKTLDGKNILIDITGMDQPAMFFLLKCLREQKRAKRVFGVYTEPLRYKTNPSQTSGDEFDLTEEFIAFRSLPGFLPAYERSKGRQLLVFMGFEGRRFTKVFEEVNPEPNHTHAVFGIPAFQPGWQYLTLGSNQAACELSRPHLHRAEANNPFDAFDVASQISETYPDLQLVLAPIGTKPHALGAALYAARHNDAVLIYDFPIKQKLLRTLGVGKSSVYNLTELLLS
jgi:hypothetical protein